MLYNLAEWAKEQIPQWLEQSIVERSMPAAAPVAETQSTAKEVCVVRAQPRRFGIWLDAHEMDTHLLHAC